MAEPEHRGSGEAWEAFDAARTGLIRTPPGFKTFDQVSADKKLAISNKSIDLVSLAYEDTARHALHSRLKAHISAVSKFSKAKRGNLELVGFEIKQRRLHVLLSNRSILPGQTLQIELAKQEAVRQGVHMTVEFAD